MPRRPFLNSMMPRPSGRPRSGRRLPKSKTAITITTIISGMLSPFNMDDAPIQDEGRRSPGSPGRLGNPGRVAEGVSVMLLRRGRRGGLLLGGHGLVDVFLDPRDA